MIQKTRKRMGICICLLTLNLLFIWGNSLLPGSVSAAFSDWVKAFLEEMFPFPSQTPGTGSGLLRKAAHFTEFAALGTLLTWLFSMLRKRLWVPFLCGFLAACTDEILQCFVPDRGPAVGDVLIDTCGAAVGMGILLAGLYIFKKFLYFKETKL